MPLETRSLIFRERATIQEEFSEHFNLIWDLKEEKTSLILELIRPIVKSRIKSDEIIQTEKAVRALGIDAEKALRIISVLRFIASSWSPFNDTAEGTLKDLADVNLLPEDSEKRSRAVNFLKEYFAFLERDSKRQKEIVFSQLVLPTIKRIDAVIDHRVVFEKEFNWSVDDPKEYEPCFETTVPVAIIKFVLHGEEPIIFQCSEEDIEVVMKQLEATAKELKKSKRLVR